MTTYPVQVSFTRGELDPKLHARVDLEYYRTGLKSCINWIVLRQGGLRKREGFIFKKGAKFDDKTVRLVPFVFSTEQAYILEFGDAYVRYYANGGIVTTDGGTPTAITNGNPAQVTLAGHGLSSGDPAYAVGIEGMVEINNREFTATVLDPNTFTIDVDATGYGVFTGGGTIKKIVETVTPYNLNNLPNLDYAQTADVITLVDGQRVPRELSRTSDTDWTISQIAFRDGPYMDEPPNNSNGVTPSATNAIHPQMTSNAAPSGTVASSAASATAWQLFDQDPETFDGINATAGWWEYTPATSRVCNSYWIKGASANSSQAPSAWQFQGWNGSTWDDLDERSAETSWGGGETRFFDFQNVTAYSKYRLKTTGSNDVSYTFMSEMGWGYNGDYGPTTTLTFDTTAGINGGAGFSSDDVDRHIRLLGADGKWRWFVITGITSNKIVTGRMYGYALRSTSKIYHWQLGAWRTQRWPQKVQFYEARRAFARSRDEPHGLWLSKTFDFYDFGTSQPLADDDGMRLRLLSNEVNAITFLAELERLAIGSTGGVRVLGKANPNAGFGATNFDLLPNVFTRSKAVKPVRVGSVALFANFYGKTLHELVYDLNQDGYIAPNVAILSEHLLKGRIVEMAYQETPDSVVWIVTENGGLVALTYEREQKVVGFTRVNVAPGDDGTAAVVESVAVIPGAVEDEVWIAVQRTINGDTVRSIECKAATFDYEGGSTVEQSVYADNALVYIGDAVNSVSGFWHLRNLPVSVLADGLVYRGLSVSSSGTVTLPNEATASTWVVGLPWQAEGRTLGLNEFGQQDGSGLGRRKLVIEPKADVFETLSLKVRGIKSTDTFDVLKRRADDRAGSFMTPRTGIFDCRFDGSWREDGEFIFVSDDPLPCTIRAFTSVVTGEP